MKVDGAQSNSRGPIAKFIRHYMRYYGMTEFVDPFCGFGNVYSALYNNQKAADTENFKYYLSDLNPYIIAVLDRLWSGEDIPDLMDRDEYHKILAAFRSAYREKENFMDHLDGIENWEVGCALVLGTLHQNPAKGWIGDWQYKKNIYDVKEITTAAPRPNGLVCKDYYDEFFRRATGRVIYCDIPEPSINNYFPFGMFFDREEFFDVVRPTEDRDNIIIYSSKHFPDNDDYEIIYTAGEEKLYIAKKWYVEDIIHAAQGYSKKRLGPVTKLPEPKRKRKRRKVSRKRRKRRRVRLEKTTIETGKPKQEAGPKAWYDWANHQ